MTFKYTLRAATMVVAPSSFCSQKNMVGLKNLAQIGIRGIGKKCRVVEESTDIGISYVINSY